MFGSSPGFNPFAISYLRLRERTLRRLARTAALKPRPDCRFLFYGLAPGDLSWRQSVLTLPRRNSHRSREANFKAMGLQTYSRSLCLSREKHYRLYLQQ